MAFRSHANRAVVAVENGDAGVYIRVENFARGRVAVGGGDTLKPELKGTLSVSAIEGEDTVCGEGCEGRGVCKGEGLLGECECAEGWVGRFCEIKVREINTEEKPEGVEGGVEVLPGSAVVEGSSVSRWNVEGDGKVLVRGRVLTGEIVVDGKIVKVGVGGSGSGMYVWEDEGWREGEVVVGRLGDGLKRDAYEWVKIVETGGEGVLVWLVRNESFGEGGVFYSLRVEDCEMGYLCEGPGQGGWEGLYIGVGAVAGVVVVVGCVFWGCWLWYCGRGRGKSEGGTADGAWEGVEVGGRVTSEASSVSR